MFDSASGNKIKENKYKILRMSLLLGNDDDREETVNNFEDAARDIDAMNDTIYLKELESKFYDTLTLEDEEKKLASLVDYIGGRVEQRISLLNDFSNITGYELVNLPSIKYYDKLDEFKNRLNYIREYLDNTKKIEQLNKEINNLESTLEKSYINKEKSEERNKQDEKIIFDRFKQIINKNSALENIDEENIDTLLLDIQKRTEESKKSLDIFNKSFKTLNNAGISYEEKEEYASYVESAKDSYYKNKESEYLLSIYKLLITKENEYSKIISKRDTINNILYERIDLRKELEIKEQDILTDLYDLLEKQYKNISIQKNDIENIDNLSKEINDKRDTVRELELDNQKVEILSLLKEFCIIDTYEGDENTYLKEDINKITNDIITNNIESNNISSPPLNEDQILTEEPKTTKEEIENNNIENINENNIQDKQIELQPPTPNFKNNQEEKTNNEPTPPKDNQVVSIKDSNTDNLEEIITKANNVMKRVGKMLGVDIGKEEIISVNSHPIEKENNNNENNKETSKENLTINNEILEPTPTIPDLPQEKIIPVDSNNLFFNPDSNTQTTPIENLTKATQDTDFWTNNALGLENLPDLPASNNNDNFLTNADFGEFKFDFGTNEEGNNI